MIRFKRNEIVSMVILCFFVGLTYWAFVLSHLEELTAVRQQYISQKALLKERKAQRRRLPALNEESKKLESELRLLDKNFLANREVSSFLKIISRIVTETGNALDLIRPDEGKLSRTPDEQAPKLNERLLRLELHATFPSLKELLVAFAEYPRLLKVKDLKIKAISERGDLQVSLLLAFYVAEERY